MIIVLASSAVDREFESQSGETKDYKSGICCFTAKHETFRSKNNILSWNQYSGVGNLC